MSYILDALKKSEQKRKQEKVPDLLTIQEVITEEPKKRLVWPYLLFAALVVNAVLISWWMRPRHEVMTALPVQQADSQKSEQTMPSPAVVQPKAEQQPGVVIQTKPEEKRMAAEPAVQPQLTERPQQEVPATKTPPAVPQAERGAVPQPRKEETRPAVPVAVPERPVQKVEEKSPVSAPAHPPEPRPLPMQSPVEPKVQEPVAAPPDNRVYAMKELPPAVQKTLPPIAISVFLYSESPSSRMVRVNDRIMREGQEVAAGLKLEEVTPDGVIFRYQGYRFKMKML